MTRCLLSSESDIFVNQDKVVCNLTSFILCCDTELTRLDRQSFLLTSQDPRWEKSDSVQTKVNTARAQVEELSKLMPEITKAQILGQNTVLQILKAQNKLLAM